MGYKEAYEAAKKSKLLKDLKPEFKKWEKEGDSIIGRLKAIVRLEGAMGGAGYNHYIFDTDDGMIKFPLSGYNDTEIGTQLRIDHIYYIEYKGKQELAGGREMKVFDAKEVPTFEDLETSPSDKPF